MAIKTVVFQKGEDDAYTSLVASEAAIASNLVHKNVVTTYSHDIRNIIVGPGPEHSIYKFYLLQVNLSALLHMLSSEITCIGCTLQASACFRANSFIWAAFSCLKRMRVLRLAATYS